ncbi:MAG: hypothetical protein GXO39_01165 [Thermotogae bacterium]|nr:hypothetical protein [Thermotogota bacterium]
MPRRILLQVNDTVRMSAVLEGHRKGSVQVTCELVKGRSVKVEGDRIVGIKKGRSLVGCRYKGKRHLLVVVVDKTSFKKRHHPLYLYVGQKVPLPKPDHKEGEMIKYLIRPRWVARIVGDSLEGLSEGRGILQVHIVNGNEVVREFPIPIIVVSEVIDTSFRIIPTFLRLKVGDVLQLRTSLELRKTSWYVLDTSVGRITPEGLFMALHPGKTVVVVQGEDRQGRTLTAKALIVVRPEKRRP